MAATRRIGRVPTDYNDRFGDCAPTAEDLDLLVEEIVKRLPDDVFWCGDDLLTDSEDAETIDIEGIINEAYDVVFAKG